MSYTPSSDTPVVDLRYALDRPRADPGQLLATDHQVDPYGESRLVIARRLLGIRKANWPEDNTWSSIAGPTEAHSA